MKEIWFDKEADILNIELDDSKEYWKSIELQNGIVLDIAEDNSIISIEILNASKSFPSSKEANNIINSIKDIS